jgi:hypothetical protein
LPYVSQYDWTEEILFATKSTVEYVNISQTKRHKSMNVLDEVVNKIQRLLLDVVVNPEILKNAK